MWKMFINRKFVFLLAVLVIGGLMMSVLAANQEQVTAQVTQLGALPDTVLPDDELMKKALAAAEAFGIAAGTVTIDQLDMSKTVFTTYDEWAKATGGEFGSLAQEWGLPQRTVFVMPITTNIDSTQMIGYLTRPNEPPSQPILRTMYVAIFADTGDAASAHTYTDPSRHPSLTNVPQYQR